MFRYSTRRLVVFALLAAVLLASLPVSAIAEQVATPAVVPPGAGAAEAPVAPLPIDPAIAAESLASETTTPSTPATPPVPPVSYPVFDRTKVIGDNAFVEAPSMSEADIQRFLNAMPTGLKSYVTTDYLGRRKRASRIIWEACQAWQISPRVVLATMQKEQSLLTSPVPSSYALRYAMGCGVFPGSTNKYPGFGRQLWYGTKTLAVNRDRWVPGSQMTIHISGSTKATITPRNSATWSLYRYTPTLHGQKLFWTIYTRYFGDPLADPQLRPVYRIYSKLGQTYIYTASELERFKLVTAGTRAYRYQGVAFSWNTSGTANNLPVYHFYNRSTRKHLYTGSRKTYLQLRSSRYRRIWQYRGVAWKSSSQWGGTIGVFAFRNRATGAILLTRTPAKYLTRSAKRAWSYRGRAYRMAP